MKISMDKQYRLGAGNEVQIYAIDRGGANPVHGAYKINDEWVTICWPENLKDQDPGSFDLVEVKPKRKIEFWVNVYPDSIGQAAHTTKESADKFSDLRTACLHFVREFEEGEGL